MVSAGKPSKMIARISPNAVFFHQVMVSAGGKTSNRDEADDPWSAVRFEEVACSSPQLLSRRMR